MFERVFVSLLSLLSDLAPALAAAPALAVASALIRTPALALLLLRLLPALALEPP